MTIAREKRVNLGNIELAYLDWGGEGPPVLALHGSFSRARDFWRLAGALVPEFSFLAADLRGWGHSDRPPKGYSSEDYRDDILGFLDALGLGPVHLIGFSLGGRVAARVAAARPRAVRSLVLLDIGPEPGGVPGAEAWLDRLARPFDSVTQAREAVASVFGRAGSSVDYFTESLAETPEGWVFLWPPRPALEAEAVAPGRAWWDEWASLEMPVLLIRGEKSWALSREVAERMVGTNPGLEYHEVEGASHAVHHDAPDLVNRTVLDFLRRAGASR